MQSKAWYKSERFCSQSIELELSCSGRQDIDDRTTALNLRSSARQHYTALCMPRDAFVLVHIRVRF